MAGASESLRLAAQAEAKLAPIVAAPLDPAYRRAIEARMKTAVTLYPLLRPIAEAYGVPVEELIAVHAVETRGKGDPMGKTSGAGATGPFQITDVTRQEFKPSREYATQVERDADIAAQHFAKARAAGFTEPEALGMTYIAGIEGVKRWGGGDEGNVGVRSKEYGPMFREAIALAKREVPAYLEGLDRSADKSGTLAGVATFKGTPAVKADESFFAPLYGGTSAEEAEAARQARNAKRDAATEHFSKMKYEQLSAEAPSKAGYK